MSVSVTLKMVQQERGFSASLMPLSTPESKPIGYQLPEHIITNIGGRAIFGDYAEIPKYPSDATIISDEERLMQNRDAEQAALRSPDARSYNHRRILGKMGLVGSVASMAATMYWSVDVLPAREAIAHTESRTEFVAHAANPSMEKNLIITEGGVGTLDSSPLAKSMPFNEIGQVAAERYDQQGFDYEEMAENAVDYAVNHGVETIEFYAHSAGGPITIGMAARMRLLLEKLNVQREGVEGSEWHPIKIIAIIIDRSPDGQLSIQPNVRTLAGRLNEVASLIPGCDVARTCRYVAEMYSRKDQFINNMIPDFRNFFRVTKNVIERKFTSHTPSGRLVEAEVNAINEYQVSDNMKKLGEDLSTQPKLLISNLEPAGGDTDPVVIGPRARKNWRQLTLQNNMLWSQADEPIAIEHQTSLQQPEIMGSVMREAVFPIIVGRINKVGDDETLNSARSSQAQIEALAQISGIKKDQAIAAADEH